MKTKRYAKPCPAHCQAASCSPQPAPCSWYTGHDILYGIPLWPVWISCPGCAPFWLPVHLLAGRAWDIEKPLN